jgi:predicted acylesterase/phospholipase RssA
VVALDRPLTHDPGRTSKIASRYPSLRVGVALSGGGYRAALFHAGVLSALEDLRIVPSNITSVSGGSITAGFYAVGGSPQSILAAVQEGRLNLKRELLFAPNALRLLLPSFSRTDVQANLLDRVLLQGKKFSEMDQPGLPILMIAATNLPTAEAVGVTRKAAFFLETISPSVGATPQRAQFQYPFITPPVLPSQEAGRFPETERLADMVAASGAFPFAFQSVVRRLSISGIAGVRTLRLADGGINDNSGVSLMLAAEQGATFGLAGEACGLLDDWRVDLVLAADAGAIIAEQHEPEGTDAGRAIDIILARVRPQRPAFSRKQSYPLAAPEPIAITPQDLLTFPRNRSATAAVTIHVLGNEPTIHLDDGAFLAALVAFPSKRDSLLRERQADRKRSAASGRPVLRTNADFEAQSLIDDELKRNVEVFAHTGTPDDSIEPDAAAQVFSLGRLLTFNQFARIDSAANERTKERTHRPLPRTRCDASDP